MTGRLGLKTGAASTTTAKREIDGREADGPRHGSQDFLKAAERRKSDALAGFPAYFALKRPPSRSASSIP